MYTFTRLPVVHDCLVEQPEGGVFSERAQRPLGHTGSEKRFQHPPYAVRITLVARTVDALPPVGQGLRGHLQLGSGHFVENN